MLCPHVIISHVDVVMIMVDSEGAFEQGVGPVTEDTDTGPADRLGVALLIDKEGVTLVYFVVHAIDLLGRLRETIGAHDGDVGVFVKDVMIRLQL
jgi:hypothetical protein